MKFNIKTCILFVMLFFTAYSGLKAQSEQNKLELEGKAYHEGLACEDCHTNAEPITYPADFVCFDCHDSEKLVAATAQIEEDKWQNPHNNLHYGKDVPCMECHGEHQTRKHLCDGCYHFKYLNYKP